MNLNVMLSANLPRSLCLIFVVLVTHFLSTGRQAECAMVDDPISNWTAISYSSGNQTDYFDDQQTGNTTSSSDIVGLGSDDAFYTQFDNGGDDTSLTDGTLFFRVRLGAPGGNSTPEFDRNLFIGVDADGDGALDLYLGVHHQGSSDELAIYGPGTDLNVSPNTTSITGPVQTITEVDGVNYDYSAVTLGDTDLDDDGETDYYLSFAYDLQTIVDAMLAQAGITMDENTMLSYVLATATQDNSFNQDLNGVGKTYSVSDDWSTLGALADPISASGNVSAVPEPGALALLGLASFFGFGFSRRSRREGN